MGPQGQRLWTGSNKITEDGTEKETFTFTFEKNKLLPNYDYLEIKMMNIKKGFLEKLKL